MSRIFSRTQRLAPALALLLSATAGLASAQQGQTPQTPPKLERIEPGSDVPTTTIPPRRGTEIREKRTDGGQVTEVEVTTPGGSHYYVKPNTQAGDIPGRMVGTPQWKVGEFDLSGKRRATSDAGSNVPTTADAPPPPPPPATAGSDRK